MTAQEAKQHLERIWKSYGEAYEIYDEDVMAFEMATNALGAIEQIQWERDMAIKQLHDLGYGLGEKPQEKLNNSNQKVEKLNQEVKKSNDLIERQAAIDAVLSAIYYDEYWMEQVERAISALPSAQPEPKTGRWIPCSERLPEDVEIFEEYPIVIFCTKDTVYVGYYEYYKGGRWWAAEDYIVDNVIAWMPLPEPYKEGDSDEQT